MLDFSLQQYPFRLGLAEGVEPHQAPPGTLTTAENVVWKKSGKVEKRFGTAALVSSILGGGSIAACARLFTRGSELCLIDGTSIYSYSPTLTTWRNAGKVPAAAALTSTAVAPTAGVAAADIATDASGIYSVNAWVAGDPTSATYGALSVQVRDTGSGSVLLPPTVLNTGACSGVRVMVIGSVAVVLTFDGTNFKGYTVNLTTMATSAGATVGAAPTFKVNYTGWDACVIGSTFVIAYSAAGSIVLKSFDNTLAAVTTGSITEANGCQLVSIDGASGEVLYVLYSQGVAAPTPVRIATADPSTLAQVTAAVTVETPPANNYAKRVGVCRFDASSCIVAYDMYDTNTTRTTTYSVSSTCVVTATSRRGTWFATSTSRPFVLGSRAYMFMSDDGYAAGALFTGVNTYLAEIETTAQYTATSTLFTPQRLVGVTEPLVGGQYHAGAPPSSAAAISSTKAIAVTPFQQSAPAKTFVWSQGCRAAVVAVGASLPSDMWRAFDANRGEVYISGGALNVFDGRYPFSYGFARGPGLNKSTSAAGGGIAAGTYLYGAIEEFRSNAGIIHRSPTAIGASQVTTGATSTNTLQFFGYGPDTKQSVAAGFGTSAPIPTLLPVYRTTVNGTTYQRLTFNPRYNTAYSDQTAEFVTLSDTSNDSDIGGSTPLSTRPAIYTTGGILDDYAPPGNVTMFHHADRLFVLTGDQKTWWYSKAFQDDLGTAPGFSPSFRISFDDTQTAGATMDDKAIFFSATGVRYMLGAGPAANGQNSDFTTPAVIQSDVGCISARSVVSTPEGVMFQAATDKLYLLTRGLELVWNGRAVKDTLAAYPVVTSAVLVSNRNQVRFTCNDTGGIYGVVLVYDYVEKQWSVSKYTVGGAFGFYSISIADACMWNGVWTFATTNGAVYYEDTTTHLDAGAWVPMTLETTWINASGPLSFQSVRNFALEGVTYTDFDMTVQVAFDSDASYQQTATFAATTAAVAVGPLDAQVSIGTRRKCGAIRFKISDATPSAGTVGTGQGASFDMMGLEVGNKRGFGNSPATKRA